MYYKFEQLVNALKVVENTTREKEIVSQISSFLEENATVFKLCQRDILRAQSLISSYNLGAALIHDVICDGLDPLLECCRKKHPATSPQSLQSFWEEEEESTIQFDAFKEAFIRIASGITMLASTNLTEEQKKSLKVIQVELEKIKSKSSEENNSYKESDSIAKFLFSSK